MVNETLSNVSGGLGSAHAVSVAAMCTVNAVALVGNFSNIVVILRSCQLRHTLTNLFVLNLCVVDLMAALLVLPISIVTFINGQWAMEALMCTINGFVNSLLTFASITNLCVISIERYYSIRLPMHHAANMTLCKTLVVLAIIWIQSIIFAGLPLVGVSSYEYRTHKKHCSFTWQDGNHNRVYVFLIGFWCFILPGLVLLFMYYGIFKIARLAATKVQPAPTQTFPTPCTVSTNPQGREPRDTEVRQSVSSTSDLSSPPRARCPRPERKQFKAIKTLIVILTAYLALWGPYFILHIHGAVFGSVVQREVTEITTTWLGYTSFALNPFLYGWMNRSIRDELLLLYKTVLCCMCFKQDPDPGGEAGGGPGGEDFWQFLERTSAKNNGGPSCSPDTDRVVDIQDCDTNNENSEVCF